MVNVRDCRAPAVSSTWSTIASPIGTIITAVAVLEIHMERKAAATMKPRMNARRSASHRVDDAEGDALVEIPPLHRQRDHEPSQEEDDRAVEVDRCDIVSGHDAEQGEEHQRKNGGREERKARC